MEGDIVGATSQVRRVPWAVTETVAGETVLLDPVGDRYLRLHASGAELWERLAGEVHDQPGDGIGGSAGRARLEHSQRSRVQARDRPSRRDADVFAAHADRAATEATAQPEVARVGGRSGDGGVRPRLTRLRL